MLRLKCSVSICNSELGGSSSASSGVREGGAPPSAGTKNCPPPVGAETGDEPRPRAIAFGEVVEWFGGPRKRHEKIRQAKCRRVAVTGPRGLEGSVESAESISRAAEFGGALFEVGIMLLRSSVTTVSSLMKLYKGISNEVVNDRDGQTSKAVRATARNSISSFPSPPVVEAMPPYSPSKIVDTSKSIPWTGSRRSHSSPFVSGTGA